MADRKQPSIGNSTNYIIGRKKYDSGEVFRLQPSLTGNAKMESAINSEAVQRVHNQTESYQKTNAYETSRAGIKNAAESVKTGVEPAYRGTVPAQVHQPGAPGNGNVKTERVIQQESVQKVYSQTAEYQKTGAYESSKAGIQSEAIRTPRMVEAVRTTEDNSFKAQGRVRQSNYIATGNVKTGNTMNTQAVQKVLSQTADYQKTNVYGTSGTGVEQAYNMPVNVAGIQTGTAGAQHGQTRSFFDAVSGISQQRISISSIATKTQGELSGQRDDLGTQAVGAGIGAGIASAGAFKAAQKAADAAPAVAKGICSVGKGVYQVGLTGGRAIVTIDRTASIIRNGQFAPVNQSLLHVLKAQSIASGLDRTVIAQRIIHAVGGIQTGIQTVKNTGNQIKTGYYMAKNTGIKIVRGVANGTITMPIARKAIEKYAGRIIHMGAAGIKMGVKSGAMAAGKGIVKGVTKGIPFVTFKTAGGIVNHGLPTIGGVLKGFDNYAVQGLGHAATFAHAGIKTGVMGVRTTGYTVKTMANGTVKTAKGVYSAAKLVKDKGLRAAWQKARQKTVHTLAKAGQGIVSLLIDAARVFGRKMIVPLIIIIVVCMGFGGIIMAPISALTAIFGSMFNEKDTDTDYDIREFLSNASTGVPHLTAEFKQNLADEMTNSWKPAGAYHIVRFKSMESSDVIEPTLDGISEIFPTDEQIINMIQPLFNAVLLMQYELEPTKAEAQNLLENLFGRLFTVTTEVTEEQCGQDLITGEGTVTVCSDCSRVHSLADCPNKETGTHTSYTCPTCCSMTCPGHSNPCDDPTCTDEHTEYCEGCVHSCSGYSYCNKHDVITYNLNIDGIYGMVAEYFTDPINELANINPRTEEEENRLQELKDYYEIFCEMMSMVASAYSGGLTMADLSGVDFIEGTRAGNQAVIDLALTQVGQVGGQPYWSYYGFASRVEWCACFVHWCMRNTPSASGSYPATANNAYCQTVANYFKDAGQWGSGGYTDLARGDTIFFDWNIDGHTDHIGLVVGRDAERVYTVEGNSGDAVKIRSYPLNSGVIYGYGLMYY